ncbi:MAG: O-antigen ligase family protein [Opitutales bacterium]|nr:O-antigen ligase family protein [Opitutales bacterium]
MPSREAVRFPEPRHGAAVWIGYLFGLLGVCLLILLGGSHHPFTLGFALILPAVALLISPPKVSLGKWIDVGVLGLLGSMLLAFVPQFYWPTMDWRRVAEGDMGIDLPSVLSVQPLLSMEAWFMALAGFAWFYAASNWRINASGRKYFHVALSLVGLGFATAVIWGNFYGVRYPGAEDSQVFSFFPNRNQTANFLALAGVVSFAFSIEGLKVRKLIYLVGVLTSVTCLAALTLCACRAGVLLYFFGIGLWFICRLRARSIPSIFKIGFPLLLLAFSFVISSNNKAVERIVEFASAPTDWGEESRTAIFKDTFDMISEAPVTGVGLGNFSAIFPQYRDDSRSFQVALHPESDLLWFLAEVGFLGLAFLIVFAWGFRVSIRDFTLGRGGPYRVIAMIAVVIFVLHSLVDVPAHRPGTVYFAILFAALAMPRIGEEKPSMPPIYWRLIGLCLAAVGCLWMLSGITRAPFHSKTAVPVHERKAAEESGAGDYTAAIESIEKVLKWKPMDWRAYFQRAQFTLSSSRHRGDAAADFRRARYLEPVLGDLSLREGYVWLPYDVGRAVSAWHKTLFRELEDKDKAYQSMLEAGRKDPKLMEAMIIMSKVDHHYRTMMLCSLSEPLLMPEIYADLEDNPSLGQFDLKQRKRILSRWIKKGDLDAAEAYLNTYGKGFKDAWLLWSLLRKEQTEFAEAVAYIRENVAAPTIPFVKVDDRSLPRMSREFAVMPEDIVKGTALLRAFIEQGEWMKALTVTDAILKTRNPPAYVYYWRAEIFYLMNDLIESWYAYNDYLRLVRDDIE